MSAIEETYLTVSEAAELLRVSPSTIRRWIRAGDLPAYRLGERSVRVKHDDLERMVTPLQPGPYPNQMAHITTTEVRRFTEEERQRGLEIMRELEQMRKADLAERGGRLHPPSWQVLAELREERTRQLMGEE